MRRIILADLLLTLGPGTTGPIYIFFFHDAKGFPVAEVSMLLLFYVAAGLAGSPFWSAVAQRLGKHRTLMVSCVAYAIMQTTLMIIPKGLFWETAAGMFAVGFSASAFVPLIRAMVGDVGDKVRLEQGKERVGLLYSMVTSTQKVGAALAVIVIYPILQAVGYNAADDAVNTPQAIFGLEMCYLFAPIAFVAVGTLSFLGYKLDDKAHAAIRAELDARDATARAEAAALEGGGIPALVVPGVVESKAS
jgi:Na+/melibiose symporter-like transporter